MPVLTVITEENTIQIQSNPELFAVFRSGTVVIFDGVEDGTGLKIPATTAVQVILFGNGTTMNLQILDGRVLLVDQIVTVTPVRRV